MVNIKVHSFSSKKLQNLLPNAIHTLYIYSLYISCNAFPQCKIHYKGGRLGYSIQSNNFLLCKNISLILLFNINKIYGDYTVISAPRTITYKFYELCPINLFGLKIIIFNLPFQLKTNFNNIIAIRFSII